MVTEQGSLNVKSVSGFKVKLTGPPLTPAVCTPVVPQDIWYQLPETLTGSSKFIVIFESSGIWVWLAPGTVLNISGGKSPVGQIVSALDVFRGFGAPAVKLPPFESVSLQPS